MVTRITGALPRDPYGCRLWELFGHYPWSFLLKQGHKSHWITEKRYPLRPRLLWKHWQDPDTQVGVRFGSSTSYAVIDIDAGSDYLNSDSLIRLEEALETLGLVRTVKIRSSFSGGLHLYLPLPKAVKTFDLAVALKETLKAHDFAIVEGHLEIFPNVKAFGRYWLQEFVDYQGHRLPLQPGSGSVNLNHAYQPVGDTLELFFRSWECAERLQDMELLRQGLATAHRRRKRYKKMLTRLEQWREDLQQEIRDGWTAYGQTNHQLKAIATYGRVFLGLELQALTDYIKKTAINSPGYQSFCRHTHEIARKSLSWARSVVGFYFPCREDNQRMITPKQIASEEKNAHKQLQCEKQRAIHTAVTEITTETEVEGWNVSHWIKAIQERITISTRTLYRYKPLWHPHCTNLRTEYLSTLSWVAYGILNPPSDDPVKPLLYNGFLQNGGGMKSTSTEILHKENLSPGAIGGCGGKEGISTAKEPP